MENGTKFILFLNSSRSNKALHPEILHYIFFKLFLSILKGCFRCSWHVVNTGKLREASPTALTHKDCCQEHGDGEEIKNGNQHLSVTSFLMCQAID